MDMCRLVYTYIYIYVKIYRDVCECTFVHLEDLCATTKLKAICLCHMPPIKGVFLLVLWVVLAKQVNKCYKRMQSLPCSYIIYEVMKLSSKCDQAMFMIQRQL